jgi:fatty acid desaturase
MVQSERAAALAGPEAVENPDRLSQLRALETAGRNVAASLSGHLAWPTILLFLIVIAGADTVAAVTVNGYIPYWVAIPVNALLIYLIFTPLHEAVHDNILPKTWRSRFLERLIGHISGFVLLAPYPGFRALHLHHHQHTNDPAEDPDYWVKSDNYLMVILRCMAIQPVYIIHLYKIARDPVTMRAFWYEMLYVASYIPVIVGAYWLGFGNELMLLWVLPAYIGVVMCPLMFDWPVHHPHTGRGRYTDSAILLFPRSVRWFMDPLFCGHAYHLMHHLYPRMPFYHYGTAYYALERELAAVHSPMIRDFRGGLMGRPAQQQPA